MSDPVKEAYECLSKLYYEKFGSLTPDKDYMLQDRSSADDRRRYIEWLEKGALYDACRKIIELEQHIAEMQEVDE